MAAFTLADANDKIARTLVNGYKKIEDGAVNGYKAIETGVVEGFAAVCDTFVRHFFTHEGETVEQAKERLQQNAAAHAPNARR